jgi:CheY-like chemotaxis protein
MQILVVDDDKDLREIISDVLAAEGHEVRVAADGIAALAELRNGRPSLILLDMMMPRLDGEGFMRSLRTDPSLADVPVVILTAHPRAREKAAALGAAGCLLKPVELTELLATVEHARQAVGPPQARSLDDRS